MDQHYDSQIFSKVSSSATTFRGPARQYGSGGLGAFAMRMGRVAVPLVKKYFVPVAKEFGRNLVSAFVPEIPKIVAGKKPPRKALKESLKKSVEKTVKTSAVRSTPPTSRADDSGGGGSRCATGRAGGGSRRATGRAGGRGGSTNPVQSSRKNKSNIIAILNKNVAKRSRSDILSSVAFTEA